MKVLIIGAGLAGLGAGRKFKKKGVDFQILESDTKPGGLTKSDEIDGFLFDCTGHFIHTKTEEGFDDLLRDSIPFDKIKRRAAINLEGTTIPYPIQYNLRHMQQKTVEKIISELSSRKETENSTFSSFSDFLHSCFGPTLFEKFYRPYNEKLWGTPLEKLPYDVTGRYFPKIDHGLLLKGSKEDIGFTGYNNYFHYPKSGKIGCLPDYLAEPIQSNLYYSRKVKRIDLESKRVFDNQGSTYAYDYLLSSIPLKEVAEMIKPGTISHSLHDSKIVNLRIAFKGDILQPYHWIYVPEKKYPFYRIGFPKNINSNTTPSGCSSLSVEVNVKNSKVSDDEMTKMVIDYLTANNFISCEKIIFSSQKLISPAYSYIKPSERNKVKQFKKYLNKNGIYSIGRYGCWEYFSMEEAYLSGKHTAKRIMELN